MLNAEVTLAAAVAESNKQLAEEGCTEQENVDERLAALAGRIADAKARTISTILEVGQYLHVAHQLLAHHGDGGFNRWVLKSCGFSRRTAYNYLAAFWTFGVCATVAQTFDARSIYALSAEGCPKAATEKAVALAKSGEHVTHKIAKDLIAEFSVDEASEDLPDPTEDDAFNLEAAESELFDFVRGSVKGWPKEYRERLSSLLQELAEEVLTK